MISVSWKIARVIAGRAMWCQPLRVRKLVVHHPIRVTSPRPKLGNQLRLTAKIRIRTMPIRKVDGETPSSKAVIKSWLPKGSAPKRRVHAHPESRNKAPGRRPRAPARAWPGSARRPRLCSLAQAEPEIALDRIGQEMPELGQDQVLSPSASRASRICSAVASCPSMWDTGSPTNWNSMNAIRATQSMTNTACASRRENESKHRITAPEKTGAGPGVDRLLDVE